MSHGIAVHEHSRRTTRQYPLLILHEWSDPDRLHAFYIWSFAFGYHAVAYNAYERLSAHSTLLSASTSTGTSSTSTSTGTSSARLPERLLLLRLPACPQRVFRNVFYFYVFSMSTARLPARLQHVFRHVTQHAYFQIYSDQSPLLLLPHSRPMTPQH